MNWYKKADLINDKDNYGMPIFICKSEGIPFSPDIVSSIISQSVKEFGCSSFEINDGNCDEFADILLKRLPGAILYEIDLDSFYPTHFFIKVGNLFYDAESPQGVLDWKQLNIYKNIEK